MRYTHRVMVVIGITGPIGHGKSTLASHLLALKTPSKSVEASDVISVMVNKWRSRLREHDAGPAEIWLEELRHVLTNAYNLNLADNDSLSLAAIKRSPTEFRTLFEYIQQVKRTPALLHEEVSRSTKTNHRKVLQWLGGYLVNHVDQGIWFKQIEKRIKAARRSSCQLFVAVGLRFPSDAAIIKRNGGFIIELQRPGAAHIDSSDPTERERRAITADTTVFNDADIEALARLAKQLLYDLESASLRQTYSARRNGAH